MELDPEFKSWLLRSDPNRPDPYGLEQKSREALVERLEKSELETLCAGCLAQLKALGDVEGHPFHGNQWTSGTSDASGGTVSGHKHHEPTEQLGVGWSPDKPPNYSGIEVAHTVIAGQTYKIQTDGSWFSMLDPRGAGVANARVRNGRISDIGVERDIPNREEVLIALKNAIENHPNKKDDEQDQAKLLFSKDPKVEDHFVNIGDRLDNIMRVHGADWMKYIGRYAGRRESATREEVQRQLTLLSEADVDRALGGSGSGNFGHAGRPGEVGGSSSFDAAHVASVMEQAKVAHTSFEKETGVPDKDWAGWYGKFVSNKLPGTTPEQMTAWITEAASIHTGADWPQKYGEHVVEQLRKPRTLSATRLAVLQAKVRKGQIVEPKALGGPGSGNFGHAGRPGEVGGSGQGGGTTPWKSPGGWEHTGITWKQPTDPKTGRPIPIKVRTVEEAVVQVLDGKVIEVEDPRTAYTVIERLAKMAADAKDRGEDDIIYDLCQVSVAGTNMFCAESLRTEKYPDGVPRLEMPQLGGFPVPGSEADKLPRTSEGGVDGSEQFVTYLQGLGIKTSHDTVLASNLRASQRELVGAKVGGMMAAKTYDPGKIPIFVSNDNYVVDGHHRWAAVVGRDAEDNKFDSKMKVIEVNAPISEVLHLANTWSQKFGIQQVAGVTKQAKATGLTK